MKMLILYVEKSDCEDFRADMSDIRDQVLRDKGKYDVESLWLDLKHQILNGIKKHLPSKRMIHVNSNCGSVKQRQSDLLVSMDVNGDLGDNPNEAEVTSETNEEQEAKTPLIYKVSDGTPIHLTLFFALQQALLSLSTSLAVSLLVAQVVCAEHQEEFKSKLLSSTLFMNGVTTLLMVLFGARLPLYQGASPEYVVPLLAFAAIEKDRCNDTKTVYNFETNTTQSIAVDMDGLILEQVQMLQGSLIVAGVIHFLVGATGLVGFLLRFIGPVTIVPTVLLLGIFITKSVAKFAQVDWGVAVLTCSVALILSLYLGKFSMPIPVWTRKKSCHVIRYPFHQVFAILIAIIVGWLFSTILTETGYYDNATNVTSKAYYARTDVRRYVIDRASWFYFPYPGQFGPIRFNVSLFIGFLIATMISIMDSIGDYYACAAICRVPPPPSHAVNRGIAVEGFCSIFSGAIGCGHATTTYGGNIGAIGLTKVASRHVFVCVGLIYIVFGVIGKVSAVFITIPYPVLGGVLIIMFGAFNGVVLSNLQSVDLSSTRNLTIIGTGLLVGLVVPHWIETYPNAINTGNKQADGILSLLLGNPNLIGSVLSCFLDNTIPGSREERGIAAWHNPEVDPNCHSKKYLEGREVYQLNLPKRLLKMKINKYLPFMPDPEKKVRERQLSFEKDTRKSPFQTF
ncbi:hypothetical protein FSP39_004171 [Pinctada imbricata]|uniref:Solute carrier family 23 member 2 n=1 Tax=Pinctada imbricata TaxID=66713 RepID=A0AA88YDQ2_PINIB|nr:hypothetical protein FSP39_004171 [Pinctada imbricata]